MTDLRKLTYVILGALVLVFAYYASAVLTPFLIAALIAYLTDPWVNFFERIKIPRTLGVVITFLILILVITGFFLVVIPLLQEQIITLIKVVPKIIEWIDSNLIPWIEQKFDVSVTLQADTVKNILTQNWMQASSVAATVVTTITQSGLALISFATKLLLVPVVLFYLLRDWNKLIAGIRGLLPRRIEAVTVRLVTECDEVLSAFLRGQLMVMIALGVLYSVGLSIVGLNMALLIGMIAGLLSIVPYLGFIIGVASAVIASLFQFHDAIHIVYIVIAFTIAQSIEGSVLTPFFVGDRIGLHPVAVIFSVLAGGSIFGFMGILLALPVAAVVMVFIRYLKGQYVASGVYTQPAKKAPQG